MMIRDGREVLKAFVTVIAVAVVVMLPIGLLARGHFEGFWSAIPLGMIIATMCGFAFWLA